jgi:hypothetical protein
LGWGERNEENLYIKRDIKDTFNKVQCMNLIWILIILAWGSLHYLKTKKKKKKNETGGGNLKEM